MKCGVVVFPGSNCDHDCYHILKHVLNLDTEWIWHKGNPLISYFDFIVLPGGFSYGDYLRAGAIARFSPIMKSVIEYANDGGQVLGICNGFQILVESGLLPGGLLHNRSQKFICKEVYVKLESNQTPFTNQCQDGAVLKIPVAHQQGNYFAEPGQLTLKALLVTTILRGQTAGAVCSTVEYQDMSLVWIATLVIPLEIIRDLKRI